MKPSLCPAVLALPALIFALSAPVRAESGSPPTLSQADNDWQAFEAVANAKPPKPPGEVSKLQERQWLEAHGLAIRDVGLAFIAKHPADPRRWEIVNDFDPGVPRFVKDWGPLDDQGVPTTPVVDEAAAAAWIAKLAELRAAMAKATDVPESLRKQLGTEQWAARTDAIRKAEKDAFFAKWKGGKTAPDFTDYDPAGKPVKLSDYRGKVVVLDFWATWCHPCNVSMPHSEEVAARYKDQGVVVLCSCTGDTRPNFDAWVKKNVAKYPDIVWTFELADRPDDRASKRLYGVISVPMQFVVGRDGKVVDLVFGYLKGENILESKLAEAGIKVDPALVEKGETDLKKRPGAGA
jgi:thiol-disulfide isomerase/thioredoxin